MLLVYLPAPIFEEYLEMLNEPFRAAEFRPRSSCELLTS
jgi:hypothetical protein